MSTSAAPVRVTDSLVINVSTLLREPIGAVRLFEVRAEGVGGSLRLLRTDQSILATAALTTEAAEVCGGCLAEIAVPLAVSFDEEFWPPADLLTGAAVEPPPERVGFAVADGQIDLGEAVRQYVELARPMSPRCGSACPGVGVEAAGEPPMDPRWAALAALQIED